MIKELLEVPTGLTDLDEKLGGLHKSDLVIIAGRPSMGKTALATNIAYHAAKKYTIEGEKSSIAFSLKCHLNNSLQEFFLSNQNKI